MTGNIFSIEEFATFDGPGIRMTVFLKGCPLSCTWCHNPEGQHPQPELARRPSGCLSCGACAEHAEVLPTGERRLSEGSRAACPMHLLHTVGERVTEEALAERILKNADLLAATGGGVTFSGGEPLAQPAFLLAMLSRLSGSVHRAVQTSGYARAETFARVIGACDYMLYDLKLVDSEAHRAFCGVDNAPILANLRTLASSGVPFVLRVPLIPTVTDTVENLTAISRLLRDTGVMYVELLPYNRAAGAKYPSLLRTYAPRFDEQAPVTPHEEIFAAYGIKTKIM